MEKGIAILSSILAWRIPWTEKPGGLYSSWGHEELDTTEKSTRYNTAACVEFKVYIEKLLNC